jgi:hypothetical protein
MLNTSMLIESCILNSHPVQEAAPAFKALFRIVDLLIGLRLDITTVQAHLDDYKAADRKDSLSVVKKSSVVQYLNDGTRPAIISAPPR